MSSSKSKSSISVFSSCFLTYSKSDGLTLDDCFTITGFGFFPSKVPNEFDILDNRLIISQLYIFNSINPK